MNKKPYRKELYIGILHALLLAGVLLWITTFGVRKKVDILFLGDSIVGRNRTETSIPALLGKGLGKEVFNGAFGGSSLAINSTGKATYMENSISLATLVDAIASGDFTIQESDLSSSRDRVVQNEDFLSVLKQLKKIDPSALQAVIIEHGVNDYNGERPLDNAEDPYDIGSFGGALRYSIETLQQTNPNMQIILVSPIYCYFSWDDEDCLSRDYGYGTMEAYVKLEKEIAEGYGICFLDLLHNLPIDRDSVYLYTTDGMHLTDEGCALYGKYLITEFQKRNILP